jgi:sortase A
MMTLFTTALKERRSNAARVMLAASWIAIVSGGALLAYAAYLTADTAVYQRIQTTSLKSTKPAFARSESEQTPPPRSVAIGDVIGEIGVPRLGMKAIVVEGDSMKILRRAVGHVPGTAFPGESGNAALAGHRDTLFRPLRNIRLGDTITFDFPGRQLRYEVRSSQVVTPDETRVLVSTGSKELTLITCFPFSYVGSAPSRYVIRASQVAESPWIRTTDATLNR